MKIAVFDPYLDTMSGGEKYMLTAAISLAKSHEVTILWDQSQRDEIALKAKRRFGFDLSKISFKDSFFTRDVSLFSRLLRSREFDAVFVLSDGSIPIVSCDLVVHFQSPMEWVDMNSFVSRVKLSRVKKFVCNSMFTKEYIDKRFHIVSDVVYPPVSVQRTGDYDEKKNHILNVGRFGITGKGSSLKKQDVLADVFSTMAKKDLKNWKMIFVMSVMDQEKDACEAFMAQYKNDPIEFVINPTNSELWSRYVSSSIYWHASGFGENISMHPDKAEHFGIATVEAMGAGLVPIVINAGGQKEIVENGVNGFVWDTREELMERTLEVIKDKKMKQTMAEAAMKSAQAYSLDHFEQKIQAIFT